MCADIEVVQNVADAGSDGCSGAYGMQPSYSFFCSGAVEGRMGALCLVDVPVSLLHSAHHCAYEPNLCAHA